MFRKYITAEKKKGLVSKWLCLHWYTQKVEAHENISADVGVTTDPPAAIDCFSLLSKPIKYKEILVCFIYYINMN